jgi:hypothetical protein
MNIVIFMRFGSLTDFTRRNMKFREIADVLKIKESRLEMIVKRF